VSLTEWWPKGRGGSARSARGSVGLAHGAEHPIGDRAQTPSPDQQAATDFFTTATRNLQEAGERAGVRRLVIVSIIGIDEFAGGYNAAKVAHERPPWRGRFRRASCARPSSTSSWKSSCGGARGAT